jgi:hypothetical protein
MTYAIERAIDEIEQRGIKEGQLKTAMAMLDDGLPPETASKYSGISVNELKRNMEKRKPQ